MWPLLTSMAKAKYYALTCKPIPAPEAERIGLITECVDDDKVMERALEIAEELKSVAPTAVRWSKMALNGWMHQAWPIYESSMALEALGIFSPDLQEGLGGWLGKRPHNFNPRSPAG
jgi:enoyl-CoA hydratase